MVVFTGNCYCAGSYDITTKLSIGYIYMRYLSDLNLCDKNLNKSHLKGLMGGRLIEEWVLIRGRAYLMILCLW